MSTKARPYLPFLAACLAIGLFSLMDALMKGLALSIGAYNAVLWRNVCGSVVGGLLFLFLRCAWPTWDVVKVHALRSVLVVMMSLAFFWALPHLPLAEAIGLSFIAPVIALFLAAVLLGEKISRNAKIASVLGLSGTAVILTGRIGGRYDPDALWGVLAVLFSAGLYAWNLVLARQQALIARPLEIAFFLSGLNALLLLPAAPQFGLLPALSNWPAIGAAAMLALCSLLLLSWANARAEAQTLIPVEYTAFGWAVLFGWLFFAEPVSLIVLAGTALIAAGSLLAARAQKPLADHIEATML